MRYILVRDLLGAVAFFSLAACGGGGGELASTPPPAPTPPPPPPPASAAVTIFASPVPGEYTSVGVSSHDDLIAADDRLTTVSTASADQPHIRYNAGGFYEIQLPGAAWDRLIHYKGLQDPTSDNTYFQPAGVAQNLGYLAISGSRNAGYSYSELGAWGNLNLTAEGGFGVVAFGSPTPSGGIPVTGSASYSGLVAGTADIMQPDFLIGGYTPAGVEGTVALQFNFGSGTLSGSTALSLYGGMNPETLGTFNFTNTVFSAGSTTYSGKFDSNVAGSNFFLGQFTGPNAQETIGAWALPFIYSGDGQAHQAIGAWIAKRP